LATASRGAVMIQAGGVVGGVALSFFIDSGRTVPALRSVFLLAAACLLLFLVVPIGWPWFLMLALIGLGSAGAQLALNALSTAYYPPAIKATGMGWAGVMSGWGSMAAPLVGAWLITLGLPPTHTLAWIALPVLLCAAGVWHMRQDWQAH
jgi:MFS transporter, AAHS family, 4-hydroxybenzoate transporter